MLQLVQPPPLQRHTDRLLKLAVRAAPAVLCCKVVARTEDSMYEA
jgi:hypothetical protein